jgi:hypothetical protein
MEISFQISQVMPPPTPPVHLVEIAIDSRSSLGGTLAHADTTVSREAKFTLAMAASAFFLCFVNWFAFAPFAATGAKELSLSA